MDNLIQDPPSSGSEKIWNKDFFLAFSVSLIIFIGAFMINPTIAKFTDSMQELFLSQEFSAEKSPTDFPSLICIIHVQYS